MKAQDSERRRERRIAVSNLEVEFSPLVDDASPKYHDSGRWPVLNVSGEGLQFVHGAPLCNGAKLSMSILARGSRKPITLRGEVRWTREIPFLDLYRTGVQLILAS